MVVKEHDAVDRITCSCGGENERCFKCDGRGWYEDPEHDRLVDALKQKERLQWTYQVTIAHRAPAKPVEESTSKHRRILLDNPLPPRKVPPERMQKRDVRLVLKSKKSKKSKAAKMQVSLLCGADDFRCTFDTRTVNERAICSLAGKFLARMTLIKKDLSLATYSVKQLKILTPETAIISVKDHAGSFNSYPLSLDSISWALSVSVKAPLATPTPRGVDPTKAQAKRKTRRADIDHAERTKDKPERTIEPTERSLDATRDYWQIRDHGQFGSYPSHDDFDD